MATIGQKLKEAGLEVAAWLDQQTGEEKRGTFDPTQVDAALRYGNPDGLRVKDWPARNKVGGHGSGDLSQVTVELAREMLGADRVSDRWDLSDLDFVEGAGALVLKLAIAAGKIVPQQPGTAQPPATPGTPTTPAPFEPQSDLQLLETIALRTSNLEAGVQRIEAALAARVSVPSREDGALTALKSIRSTVEIFGSTLGDRPAPELRRFLAGVLSLIAEGGA
jgi:hypothetical protein